MTWPIVIDGELFTKGPTPSLPVTQAQAAPGQPEENMQMEDCLSAIMDGPELSADACKELDEAGFTVVPGPVELRTTGVSLV